MKKRFIYILFILCLVFTSCLFWDICKKNNSEDSFENVYNLQEEWSTSVRDIFQVCKPLQNENILYIMEDGYEDYGFNNNYNQFHYVEKMNLENGKILCRSQELPNSVFCEMGEYDNYLFFLDRKNNLIFLDKEKLSIEKNIKIGLEKYSENDTCHILRYKDNLIWGNKSNTDKKNMVMVNVPELFAMEDGQEYIPELLYDQANGNCVCSFIMDGDVLYFLTSNWLRQQGEEISTLYAYNIETKQTLWKKEIPDILGEMSCSLQIIDEKLYLIETSLYCFNKTTGEIIWEKIQPEENLLTEAKCVPHFALLDLIIDDNKVFFSGGLCESMIPDFSCSKEYIKNLFCYDLKNGKYVWGDLIPKTASLNSLMVINDGKLFISTIEGFRIYDKKIGKLLGDYPEYYGREKGRVFYYNNKYIFFDKKDLNARYVAVSISEK